MRRRFAPNTLSSVAGGYSAHAGEGQEAHTRHPRVYLRRFAANGLLVAERTGCEPQSIGVPEVGVRKRFYTLKRSDGTSSNEVENSLGTLENKVSGRYGARAVRSEVSSTSAPTRKVASGSPSTRRTSGL